MNKKHEMRVMGHSGDERIEWDVDVTEEVSLAEEFFNESLGKGYAAFAVPEDPKEGQRIEIFDPDAERIVLVPPISGG